MFGSNAAIYLHHLCTHVKPPAKSIVFMHLHKNMGISIRFYIFD